MLYPEESKKQELGSEMTGSDSFGKTKMANKVVPQKNDLSLYKGRFFYFTDIFL